ncbi:GDP-mannose 4,6-dehydratase [Streptomyces sp. NPDC088725]|uniref:GDP-mannose 4,6-dehydratase n=1 Tax=Streptomyces sp. NPDC088725 TaxID=3365873 RepID=UPI00380FC9A2
MRLMLQQDEADDCVIGTGRTHSVRDAVRCAFDHAGLDREDHVFIHSGPVRPAGVEVPGPPRPRCCAPSAPRHGQSSAGSPTSISPRSCG